MKPARCVGRIIGAVSRHHGPISSARQGCEQHQGRNLYSGGIVPGDIHDDGYHRAYHPSFADRVPYNLVLVELDEGLRLIATVIGVSVKFGYEEKYRLPGASS